MIATSKFIDRETAEKIISDYNNNLTIRSISKKYNLKYNRVNKILVVNNVVKRTVSENNKLEDYKKNCKLHFLEKNPSISTELKKLYCEGKSLELLGEYYNVSHVTIKNWLIKLGANLRTIKESNSLATTKDRKVSNMREKYGVDNPMQLLDIHIKAMKSGYRLKPINIEGRQFEVQGYEPQALKYLVKEGVLVDTIKTGKDVPIISYTYKNKSRKYFPDFYISENKTIYEVKSLWTYSQQKNKNKLKAKATAQLGYRHITLIFDNEGSSLLKTIITTK